MEDVYEVSLFGEVGSGGLIYVSATSFPRTLIFPPERPWKRAHADNVFVRGEHSLLLIIFNQEQPLKWYYDQKIISFFSSDFESVFA